MLIREILDSLKLIAIAVFVALFITKFVGQTAIVHQYSMQNTLFEGDVLWVEKITPKFGTLRRGDIITIYTPLHETEKGNTLIKRVIGVEGDFVSIKDGKVYVNGSALKQDYTKGINTTKFFREEDNNKNNNNLTIPAGKLYCLGDNMEMPIIKCTSVDHIKIIA